MGRMYRAKGGFFFAVIVAVFLIPNMSHAGRDFNFMSIERTRSSLPTGERYAVIVGISDYKNPEYDLEFAHRDALAFRDFLLSPKGGQFKKENVRFLLNQEATAQSLRSALGTFLADTTEDDFVIIFFAGHGSPTGKNREDLYLLTYEADLSDLAGTSFPMDEVKRYLEKSIKAKRVLMVTDSCHSGGITLMGGGGGENPLSKYLVKLSETRPGLLSITASEKSQASAESRQFGGGHGAFTYFLLRALKEDALLADSSQDLIVDVAEAFGYARKAVIQATGGQQRPDKAGDLTVGFPLAVIDDAPTHPESLKVAMGMYKEVDGQAEKVKSGDVLHSGDSYFFLLQVERPCYIYLFQKDSSGAVFRLFPSDRFHTSGNPVSAGQKIFLPNDKEVFFLDETVGREEINLFAATDKIPELDRLVSGRGEDLKEGRLRTMGPAGIKPRQGRIVDGNRDYEVIVDELAGTSQLVYKIEFVHEQ